MCCLTFADDYEKLSAGNVGQSSQENTQVHDGKADPLSG